MARNQHTSRAESKPMLFSSKNYKILSLGLLLVIVGFTAMYMENEVQGFISLFISPILIMAGYLAVILAIMKRDDKSSSTPEHISG